MGLGYLTVAVIFGALIAAVTLAYYPGVNAVLTFWIAYVLTRPFGASIGDLLTADTSEGGLGLDTNTVSAVFLLVIPARVGWFTVQDRNLRAAEVTPAR
jgi:uncharacterized membrane-anchored protein